MPRIFISYRRADSAYIADTISQAMQQRFGSASVFFDVDAIPFGVDFRAHIANAVKQCDVLLAIIGDRWLGDSSRERRLADPDDYVRIEVESALERGIPVIPVLVGSATIPSDADLPESMRGLRYRNAAEVRPGRDLQQHLQRLVRGVESTYQQQGKEQKPLQQDETAHAHTTRHPNRMKGIAFSILIFVFCLVTGLEGGAYLSDVTANGALGFLVAVPLWSAGIILPIYVWRRYNKT